MGNLLAILGQSNGNLSIVQGQYKVNLKEILGDINYETLGKSFANLRQYYDNLRVILGQS